MRVLIVEDDTQISQLLQKLLVDNNLSGDCCGCLSDAYALCAASEYDAVILDIGLPDGDGRDLLRHIQKKYAVEHRPVVIVLTARDGVNDKVEGFEAGALDYIVKPYEPMELLARLRVCLQFKRTPASRYIECGNVRFDTTNRQVYVGEEGIQLTRRELAIFEKLILRKGNVVPYEQLIETAFGIDEMIESNALAAHTSRLRKTLRDAGADIGVKSVRHIGYYIEES